MSKLSKILASGSYIGASICLLIFAINLQSIFLYIGIALLLCGVIISRFVSHNQSSFISKMDEIANDNSKADSSSKDHAKK